MPPHPELHSTADASTEFINVMLSPDIVRNHAARSSSRDGNTSPPTATHHRDQRRPETPRVAGNRKNSERHVTFEDPVGQQQAIIHPLFRQRPKSGRAGAIDALDDWIARHGGTTSSYEELPHRLKISKRHQLMTPLERVVELTKTNGFLLQELAYHKDTRAAEMRFMEKAAKLRAKMEGALADFDRALEERSKARADAESTLLNYWGIDLADGNMEDSIF
ncbi:MAG: hypothetical protein Q9217_000169 [Psora testacea]